MNIYKALNDMISYVEKHLDEKIDYQVLAKILGTNSAAMENLFSLLCGITLKEYIRKRRLSCAGVDLVNSHLRIIDIAIKYQYDNPTSFSRAFTKFHGIKPKDARKNLTGLQNFPKIHFDERLINNSNISYDIVEKEAFTLYGIGVKTNDATISKDAPQFFSIMKRKYQSIYGPIPYGMVYYESRFCSDNYEYWILYDKEIPEFHSVVFPKSKWLVFHIPSQEAEEIQKISHQFYFEFLPSVKYRLKPLPELEYYHDNETDFLIPIE